MTASHVLMPSTGLHPLVDRWLDSLQALDLEDLVDCYDPRAVLQAFQEVARGRDEIEDHLATFRRYLRGMRVDDVRPVEAGAGRFSFETSVRGRLGSARIRHDWVLSGDRITDHVMRVLDRGGVAATA